MFCNACGKQMPAEATFCNGCGARLNSPAAAPQQPAPLQQPEPPQQMAPPQPQYTAPPQAPQSGNTAKIVIPIVAVAVLAVVIAVVLIFVLGGSNIEGRWNVVEFREYTDGRLDWVDTMSEWEIGEYSITFNSDGTGYIYDFGWTHNFTWETSGRTLTMIDNWGSAEEIEFRVRRNELRLTERGTSWGSEWEDVTVLQRAR
jgi:YD repeat-containing protein